MKYDKQTSSKFSVLYRARYCAQEDISIVVWEDTNIKMLEHPFCLKNITNTIPVCPLLKTNRYSKLFVSGSNFYLFGESEQKSSFVKFTEPSKSWNILPSFLDKRSRFCVCSFMQKIVVIGGNINKESLNSCMAYDINTNKWNYIASMNKSREDTSCTVFKGKIVTTGGWRKMTFSMNRSSTRRLKSVEAYSFHENKWTKFLIC